MPVILKKKALHALQLGVWKITEEESYFRDRLNLTNREEEQLAIIKGQRRVHWLATRYLMHLMTDPSTPRIECIKDEFGKPHLHPHDDFISFSHSGELVAASMGPGRNGIDIQSRVGKIARIAHKFVRDDEKDGQDPNELELHIIWGAKEAAYKAYGRKKLDFKENMKCSWNHIDQSVKVVVQKEVRQIYNGQYEIWGPYVLVYLDIHES